jgi:type VI secretion system Hcp family effector
MRITKRSLPAALKPLRDKELSAVSGGRVQHSELQVTKLVDKASPKLYEACSSGRHLPEAKLVL